MRPIKLVIVAILKSENRSDRIGREIEETNGRRSNERGVYGFRSTKRASVDAECASEETGNSNGETNINRKKEWAPTKRFFISCAMMGQMVTLHVPMWVK